jgi:hypothetical protein
LFQKRPVSLGCIRHHPVLGNLDIKTCKHEGGFCGHFSRVVVSDFRSLCGDIVSEALSARQSPAAKIPFLAARQIFLTLPAACTQRSVLGGKIADTRRPGPPVGGGTRLWYSCYGIFLREGQPMTHGTPPFSADAALRHFRSYFTEPKDVVAHPQLSRDEKLAILREWEQDALRLSTSESEGMGGGEESMLGRVEESIGILERSPR